MVVKRIVRLNTKRCQSLYALSLIGVLTACSQPTASPCDQPAYLSLCQQASQSQTISVIVTYHSTAAAQQDPQHFATEQARVIQQLPQQGVVIEHAFTALPQLVLTVDKSSLEQLLSLDSVLNVTLDEVAYPQ